MKQIHRLRLGFILFLVTGMFSAVQGQQDPMFTQYFSNQLMVNPAYAGSRDGLSILGLYRHQWTGFSGAPKTQTLGIHSPILGGGSAIGVGFIHDMIGITERFALNGSYAYRIDLGRGARLALGLQGQARLRQMHWNRANPLDEVDGSIAFTRQQLFLPNFGAGIYFDTEHFFLGLSVPHMLENELAYASQSNNQNLSQLKRHFFLSSGLIIGLSKDVKLRPMLLWKYVPDAPMEFDFSLGAWFKEKFLLGATYRTNASFDLFAQFQINEKLRFGYAYDYPLTRLKAVNSGSHEILLGIDLKNRKKGFDHPRYF